MKQKTTVENDALSKSQEPGTLFGQARRKSTEKVKIDLALFLTKRMEGRNRKSAPMNAAFERQ
jgi:hypothetical protein